VIVVDSSAVIAVIRREDDFERFLTALENADAALMSNANFLEVVIVLIRRYGAAGLSRLDRVQATFPVELRDVDAVQLDLAIDAYARFGRGTGHPAGLNFGDCFAYALAKAADAPLLYKGGDFAMTDVAAAI
jgi:ribonuclease VapC